MTEPRRETKAQALADNRERIARACREIEADIDANAEDGKLEIMLDFLEQLLRQRRRIKASPY